MVSKKLIVAASSCWGEAFGKGDVVELLTRVPDISDIGMEKHGQFPHLIDRLCIEDLSLRELK